MLGRKLQWVSIVLSAEGSIKESPYSYIRWSTDLNTAGIGLYGTHSGTANAPDSEGICIGFYRPGGDIYQIFAGYTVGLKSRMRGGAWK